MHIVVNGGLTEGRQGHEKRNCKSYEIYCCGECIDTLCDYDGMWLRTEKMTDPASEQVLKISITPEPSPTPAPDTVDAAAVTSNGDISMVNLYLAENPSAVTNSTDTGAGDANTTDASNMQNQDQDQSEDTSGSSDE